MVATVNNCPPRLKIKFIQLPIFGQMDLFTARPQRFKAPELVRLKAEFLHFS
jgi:hypothetical protein